MNAQKEPSNSVNKKYLLNKLLEDIRDNSHVYKIHNPKYETIEAISIINALFGVIDYCNFTVEWGSTSDISIDTKNQLLYELSKVVNQEQIGEVLGDVPSNIAHGTFYPAIKIDVNEQMRNQLLKELSKIKLETMNDLFKTFVDKYKEKFQMFEKINFTPGIAELNLKFDGNIIEMKEALSILNTSALSNEIITDLKNIVKRNEKKQINNYFKKNYSNISNENKERLQTAPYLKNAILNGEAMDFSTKQLLAILNGEQSNIDIAYEMYSEGEQKMIKESLLKEKTKNKDNEIEM